MKVWIYIGGGYYGYGGDDGKYGEGKYSDDDMKIMDDMEMS